QVVERWSRNVAVIEPAEAQRLLIRRHMIDSDLVVVVQVGECFRAQEKPCRQIQARARGSIAGAGRAWHSQADACRRCGWIAPRRAQRLQVERRIRARTGQRLQHRNSGRVRGAELSRSVSIEAVPLRRSEEECLPVPVIQVRNHYRSANGEIGDVLYLAWRIEL